MRLTATINRSFWLWSMYLVSRLLTNLKANNNSFLVNQSLQATWRAYSKPSSTVMRLISFTATLRVKTLWSLRTTKCACLTLACHGKVAVSAIKCEAQFITWRLRSWHTLTTNRQIYGLLGSFSTNWLAVISHSKVKTRLKSLTRSEILIIAWTRQNLCQFRMSVKT